MLSGEKELLKTIQTSVVSGDEEATVKACEEALKAGIAPMVIMQEGVTSGMDEMGQLFSDFKAYLPELVASGEAAKASMKIIEPHIKGDGGSVSRGTIVMGTVQGDLHDIGKNIVVAVLVASGFNVLDLGIDVKSKEFVKKAKEANADIIGLSSLLTNSLPYQKDVVDYLKDLGEREKFYVIVGGGPVTPDFAEEIGADGYARLASDAVRLCKDLVEGPPPGSKTVVYGKLE